MGTRPSCAALVAVLLATSASCAPSAERAPATPGPLADLAADSAVIMEDLRFLSSDEMRGRGTGTEEAARARAHLAARLSEAGPGAAPTVLEQPFSWSRGDDPESRTGVNLVAIRRGTVLPGSAIVVSGHYDHVGTRNGEIYNGADDNASGAVGITALARALRRTPLRHTVIFAALDAEEVGLRGARAFLAAPPVPLDSVALNLNLDMVARTGGVLWAGGAYHTPALRPLLEAVAARAPLDLRLGHDSPDPADAPDWTGQSDHGAFHQAGIPFVYLGVEDHPDYHRPTDDFENVVPGEYMNALRTALMILLALDRALPLPGS